MPLPVRMLKGVEDRSLSGLSLLSGWPLLGAPDRRARKLRNGAIWILAVVLSPECSPQTVRSELYNTEYGFGSSCVKTVVQDGYPG